MRTLLSVAAVAVCFGVLGCDPAAFIEENGQDVGGNVDPVASQNASDARPRRPFEAIVGHWKTSSGGMAGCEFYVSHGPTKDGSKTLSITCVNKEGTIYTMDPEVRQENFKTGTLNLFHPAGEFSRSSSHTFQFTDDRKGWVHVEKTSPYDGTWTYIDDKQAP